MDWPKSTWVRSQLRMMSMLSGARVSLMLSGHYLTHARSPSSDPYLGSVAPVSVHPASWGCRHALGHAYLRKCWSLNSAMRQVIGRELARFLAARVKSILWPISATPVPLGRLPRLTTSCPRLACRLHTAKWCGAVSCSLRVSRLLRYTCATGLLGRSMASPPVASSR
jgi:hypothetical protein